MDLFSELAKYTKRPAPRNSNRRNITTPYSSQPNVFDKRHFAYSFRDLYILMELFAFSKICRLALGTFISKLIMEANCNST